MRTGLDKNAGLVGLLLDPYVWILDVHPFSSLEARGACTVPARATSGWRGPLRGHTKRRRRQCPGSAGPCLDARNGGAKWAAAVLDAQALAVP